MTLLPESLPLSERQLRLLRGVSYVGFGLVVFLCALYASIPRDRLRERLERELSQDPSPQAPLGTGMDVAIGDLGLSLVSPGIHASEVTLKLRPGPAQSPAEAHKLPRYFIDSLDLRVPLWDLLLGRRVLKADLEAFSGTVSAEAGLSGDEAFARARAEQLALALLPGVAQAVPLPLVGKLGLSLDLKAPLDKRTQRPQATAASGQIELAIEDCVLGNGKAKLVVAGDPFLSQGLTFPRMNLGKVSGKIVVDKGRATLEQLRVRSADVEAQLDGYIDLRDPINFSDVHLYFRFKPSEALVKKEPPIELMMSAMAGQAKRQDGFLGFAITGVMATPVVRPAKDAPPGITGVRSGPIGEIGEAPPPPSGELPGRPSPRAGGPSLSAVRPTAPLFQPPPAQVPPVPAPEPVQVPPATPQAAVPASAAAVPAPAAITVPPPAPTLAPAPAATGDAPPAGAAAAPGSESGADVNLPPHNPTNQRGE